MPALIAVEFAANQILQVEGMVREKLKMGIMIRKASNFLLNVTWVGIQSLTLRYSKTILV
jgi:hypothetical protein